MVSQGLKSFCGLTGTGGVAGPTQSAYICPDCIGLTYELHHDRGEPQIVFTTETEPRLDE